MESMLRRITRIAPYGDGEVEGVSAQDFARFSQERIDGSPFKGESYVGTSMEHPFAMTRGARRRLSGSLELPGV
jgi:hypothetical protein